MVALKQCIDRAYAPVKKRLPDLPDVSGGLDTDIAERFVFIAELGEAIAGCAILGITETEAHLANIAVDPDMKGMGVGRQLMTFVEDFARQNKVRELHLATHVKMPENVALYQHLGWHETSRSGNKVLMRKLL